MAGHVDNNATLLRICRVQGTTNEECMCLKAAETFWNLHIDSQLDPAISFTGKTSVLRLFEQSSIL